MKKLPLRRSGNQAVSCSRLSVRLSDGQLCTLLGLIDVGLNERANSFSGEDLRQLVQLHSLFGRRLGFTGADYVIRDGYICNARRPDERIARVGQRRFSKLTLALSNG